jgi:hypothetical protein
MRRAAGHNFINNIRHRQLRIAHEVITQYCAWTSGAAVANQRNSKLR